jgi:hypothetical protein
MSENTENSLVQSMQVLLIEELCLDSLMSKTAKKT